MQSRHHYLMLGDVVMRQTELHLTDADRALVDEIRSKGLHQAREVNRAHVLSSLDRGVPVRQGRRSTSDSAGVFDATCGPTALDDDGTRTSRTPGAWYGQGESRNCAAHAQKNLSIDSA